VTWAVSLLALAVGVVLGPALERLARWSLREPAGAEWQSRSLVTGLMAGTFAAAATLLVPAASLIPAWVALAFIAAPIARTDLSRHRIPDALNAIAFAAGAVLLLVPGDAGAYGRAWLAALAVAGSLLLLALIGPSGLGMGDVKLGPTLGLYLGFLGWQAVLIGIASGFVLGAAAGLVLLLREVVARRPVGAVMRRALPFGPFLLVGTLVGLAV
jgi:leader peptidase (prepilin peptidase)/N-methyltransferase